MTLREAWARGQEGWPRRFVVAQFPNPPLIVALVGSGVARATEGGTADAAHVISRIALAVFAALEVLDGANWFRRLLGVIVAIYLVIDLKT